MIPERQADDGLLLDLTEPWPLNLLVEQDLIASHY